MKTKTKTKGLSLSITFLLIFGLIFGLALTTTVIAFEVKDIDFEDGVIGNDYTKTWNGSTYIFETSDSSIGNITNIQAYGGSKSFRGGDTSGVFTIFDLTYPSAKRMKYIDYWLYADTFTGSNAVRVRFRNNQSQQIGEIEMRDTFVRWEGESTENMDEDNDYSDTWIRFNVTFYTDGLVDVGMYNGTGWNNISNAVSNSNWGVLIQDIGFLHSSGLAKEMFFDDISLVFEDRDAEGEEACDISAYNSIGQLFYNEGGSCNVILPSTTKYLETKFDVPTTMTIEAVDLVVSQAMTQRNYNFSDYGLVINGEEMGIPSCFVEHTIIDCVESTGEQTEYSILRWYDLSKSIANEKINFAFQSDEIGGLYNNRYWVLPYGSVANDIFADGHKGYKKHNTESKYLNTLYDGTELDKELLIKFYFTGSGETQAPSQDLIYTDKAFYNTNDTIRIAGEVSDLTLDNYIDLYIDNISKTIQKFPKLISGVDFTTSLFAPISGYYSFALRRNSINYSMVNVTVYDLDRDYTIYTNPNPSSPEERFTVNYTYNNADNRTGKLVMSLSNNLLDTDKYIDEFFIYDNGDGSIEGLSYPSERIIYFILAVADPTNTTFTGVYYYTHAVKNIHLNVLTIRYPTGNWRLDLSESDLRAAAQRYDFTHNYLGWNIVVKLNGVLIQDIGHESVGTFEHAITESGIYNSTMVLITGQGEYLKAIAPQFIVIDSEGEIPDQPSPLFPEVGQPLGAIIGLIITIGLTLVPMFIGGTLLRKVDIPPVLYAIFCALGMGVSIYFGFFDWWILFAVLFIALIVTILLYIRGKH